MNQIYIIGWCLLLKHWLPLVLLSISGLWCSTWEITQNDHLSFARYMLYRYILFFHYELFYQWGHIVLWVNTKDSCVVLCMISDCPSSCQICIDSISLLLLTLRSEGGCAAEPGRWRIRGNAFHAASRQWHLRFEKALSYFYLTIFHV